MKSGSGFDPAPLAIGPHFWAAAAVLWTAVVFGMTVSSISRMEWVIDKLSDKTVHGVAFAVGAFLWAQALLSFRRIPAIASILIGGAISFAVGAVIEYMQRFVPGRSPDIVDLAANTIGILIAVVLLLWRYRGHRTAIKQTS